MAMFHEELKIAVCGGNLERVKHVLSMGADVNHTTRDGESLLHLTRSVEVTKELLSHGANVNAQNNSRETPLRTAISEGKGLEIVKVLLKYGAYVDAKDRHGNTPLNLAVKKRDRNMEVVKELLEHGANINTRNRVCRLFENHNSPLDNAINDLECGKLLIKITLLNNFDKNYRKIFDLASYKDLKNYSEFSLYLDNCVSEVIKMRADKINDNLSLHEYLITKNLSKEVLYTTNDGVKVIKDQVLAILNSTNYNVYHEIISAKIKLGLADVERESLLKMLSELQVYTESDVTNWNVIEKKVVLDSYSVYEISKYLSNDDLLSLTIAFYKHPNQSLGSSDNLVELKKQPSPNEISTGSCTKRARLESLC